MIKRRKVREEIHSEYGKAQKSECHRLGPFLIQKRKILQTIKELIKNRSGDRSACFSRIVIQSIQLTEIVFSANIRKTLPRASGAMGNH